jgi:hypothetical protein
MTEYFTVQKWKQEWIDQAVSLIRERYDKFYKPAENQVREDEVSKRPPSIHRLIYFT